MSKPKPKLDPVEALRHNTTGRVLRLLAAEPRTVKQATDALVGVGIVTNHTDVGAMIRVLEGLGLTRQGQRAGTGKAVLHHTTATGAALVASWS